MIANRPSYSALIVDDESAIRVLTSRALTGVGFKCQMAGDGREAAEKLRAQTFDVVITDLRMPHRNGHSLAVEMLSRGHRPLVIVLTGILEPRIAHDLIVRGVDEVCFKPLDFRAFAVKVLALVQRRRRLSAQPTPNQTTVIESILEQGSVTPVAPPPKGTVASDPFALESSASETDTETAATPATPAEAENQQAASGGGVRHRVVILTRSAERAQQISEKLASETVESVVAAGSEAFYELLNQQRVDLMIVEQILGGFLTGTEIIERLHRDLLRVDTILIAEPSPQLSESADRLDVKAICSPSANDDSIIETVRRLLSYANASKVFIPHRARRVVEECGDIRPMPQVLIKLLSYLDLDVEEIPAKELADTISLDSQATASLLARVNSAEIGLRQKATRPLDAVALLGPRRAISLIVSSAAITTQGELMKDWSEPLRMWYSQRSVLTASAASVFAEQFEKVSGGTAFVLGLLQDIGILVLGNCDYGRYEELTLRRAREVAQVELSRAEYEYYQVTHADVSAALLQKWGLPQSLVGLVAEHHEQDSGEGRSRLDRGFRRAMQIGEAIANMKDVNHPVRHRALTALFDGYPANLRKECGAAIQTAVEDTVRACRLFGNAIPDEAEFCGLTTKIQECRKVSLLP